MSEERAAQSTSFGMGTEITHRAFGRRAEEALRAVEEESRRLEGLLSRFLPGSEIAGVNGSAGLKSGRLSPETWELLSLAARFSRASEGLFDVTVAPLVDLWDYKNASSVPEEERIRRALALVNYRDLELYPGEKAARLRNPGQSIDLGGLGKGFASERFAEVFAEYGLASAFTNVGGNVRTLGNRPDGSPWRVGLRHPRLEGRLLGAVEVSDAAVVTSGDYERYFIDPEGRRRCHILNPISGYPAESGLASVTVISEDATTADALSTALFVAGLERGLPLLGRFPGAEAVFADTSSIVYITVGLKKRFRAAGGVKIRNV